MSASLPLRPPFAEALATLCYCLLHPAESSEAAMHLGCMGLLSVCVLETLAFRLDLQRRGLFRR